MKLEAPTPAALRGIAQCYDLPIEDGDLEIYAATVGGMTAAYAALDALPGPDVPDAAERAWRHPIAEENPHNAWYVQSDLQTRSEGRLAGRRVAPKDNVMLAGVPMLSGSKILTDFVADVDATIVTRLLDAGLRDVDCLLLPTCPMMAPPLPAADAALGERFARAGETATNTGIFDATHHPAISLPCGEVDGLPVGMMLVGRHHEEALLYGVACAFEEAQG